MLFLCTENNTGLPLQGSQRMLIRLRSGGAPTFGDPVLSVGRWVLGVLGVGCWVLGAGKA